MVSYGIASCTKVVFAPRNKQKREPSSFQIATLQKVSKGGGKAK